MRRTHSARDAPRAAVLGSILSVVVSCAYGVDVSGHVPNGGAGGETAGSSAAGSAGSVETTGSGGATIAGSGGTLTQGSGGADTSDAGIDAGTNTDEQAADVFEVDGSEMAEAGADVSNEACTATTDRDMDGTPDCLDACPDDPLKTQPGVCGCGASEACAPLKTGLVHRYRFLGTGAVAADSVGKANGSLKNVTLSGSGTVVLAGAQSDQYVDLPNGIVHTLVNATFEAWITWQGGNAWQRVFDFGDDTSQVDGAQGTGRSYLFLTPTTGGTTGTIRTSFLKAGSTETIVNSVMPMPTGVITELAVVVDDQNNRLQLYLNGGLEGSATWSDSLSLINDINVWLGRSQFVVDPELAATYHEFRIYNVALTATQISLSAKAGPDPGFLN